MSIILAFVALSCGAKFGGLGALVSVILFKILPLMSSLYEGVWVLDLLIWGYGEDLDIEAL